MQKVASLVLCILTAQVTKYIFFILLVGVSETVEVRTGADLRTVNQALQHSKLGSSYPY